MEVETSMTPKKERQMFFPFMSHHEWYGFEDAQDLVAFLEDGVYPEDNTHIDRKEIEELKMLPPPKDANGNGKSDTVSLLDHRGKPIVRARGNVISEVTIPVKEPEEPKVIEETVIVKPGYDSETIEVIREDIASGGNGG